MLTSISLGSRTFLLSVAFADLRYSLAFVRFKAVLCTDEYTCFDITVDVPRGVKRLNGAGDSGEWPRREPNAREHSQDDKNQIIEDD